MNSRRPSLLILLASPMLGACSLGGLNNEPSLGGTVLPETFASDHVGWFAPPSGTQPDARSVDPDSLSRAQWSEYPFVHPVSGVEHFPTYRMTPQFASDTRRQRGEYPNADSVLDTTTSRGRWQQALEGLAAPAYMAADMALLPVRAVLLPPWTTVVTPRGPVNRLPEPPTATGAAEQPVSARTGAVVP